MNNTISHTSENIPESYQVGEKAFYGNSFFVGDTVLIPRPETELIVDIALALMLEITTVKSPATHSSTLSPLHKTLPPIPHTLLASIPTHIVDCGTGSGCIGISILAELCGNPIYHDIATLHPKWTCTLSDISEDALCVAKHNMKQIVPTDSIPYEVIQSNLLEYFISEKAQDNKPDIGIILANLPYVAPHHLNMLSLAHEPRLALEGTLTHHTTQHNFSDGLEIIQTLFQQTAHFTHRHILILEADPLQMDMLSYFAARYGYTIQGTLQDYAHYPRIFYCIK